MADRLPKRHRGLLIEGRVVMIEYA